MVKGLTISSPKSYDHVCEGCVLGKSHRLPFPKVSHTQYEKMELIVVDLSGPMSVKTWTEKAYAFVVVEMNSRLGVGELLNDKTESAGTLKTVVAMLERQSGKKLKRMRTDVGKEWLNGVVGEFCRRNGILHETTVPYTPEQNGVVERAIATYFEMVRCMLHSAGMDLRYWGEALMYAIHIRNLSPTAAISDKVPMHVWTGHKPDVSHLRVFGSTAFANIPKKIRGGKLEVTSVKCRLLGWWENETKGYRLEDLATRSLITSRDVRFVEDDAPTELAVIEGEHPLTEDTLTGFPTDDPPLPESRPTSPIPTSPTTSVSDIEPEGRFEPDPTPAVVDPPPKQSKWTALPPREPSSRTRSAPTRFGDEATPDDLDIALNAKSVSLAQAFMVHTGDPPTYRHALRTPHSKEWEAALATEYDQLINTGTFEWTQHIPAGRKTIGSKLICHEKLDGEGDVYQRKVRLVARGFSQIPGQDFHATHSAVAKYPTLRALLAIAAREDMELHQLDVVGAYLQGDLDEEIYMSPPDGLKIDGKKGWSLKLHKPLYGLKQAGRQWKKKLDETMAHLGFAKSDADECLYIQRDKGKVVLLVLVYVDDAATASRELKRIEGFKKQLQEFFPIKDLGELRHILGIQVTRDRKARTITINQTAYIRNVLARFGMSGCTPVSTPFAVGTCLTHSQSPTTPEERAAYAESSNGIEYLEGIGSALYITQTRPDIQHPIGVLAQFGANPGKAHIEAFKRLLRYLKGTAEFGLTLGGKDNGADLIGWTDSDWAQDPESRRSISGYVFDVAGGSVSWASKRQPTVALSTTEAEYMAAANATKEAIWLRVLLEDMGFPQIQATTLHADNMSCIALSRGTVTHSRAKHIDIRHHFIRERIANSEINLQHVSTRDMLADILTKQLPREAFEKFRNALGVGERR
jgi:hypothetical protein